MKIKLQRWIVLAGFVAVSATAQDSKPTASGDRKVSYAAGMNLGLQIKRIGADVDVAVIIQGLKDVMDGKPTQMPESELRPIFKQEETVERAKQSVKNIAEGDAFLAKNAKVEGITVLPDGLQYRIIQAGAGPMPKSSDTVVVNYRGKFIDGKEFDRRDHFEFPLSQQVKGWQEVLPLMKTGSKWQLFMPSALAYGHKGRGDVGPDATVIFEIELISTGASSDQPGGDGQPNVIGQSPAAPAAGK